MDMKGGDVKTVKHRITLTRFEDNSMKFIYEGLSRRSEALPLLRECDRDIKLRLNRGKPLEEKDLKIKSLSPELERTAI